MTAWCIACRQKEGECQCAELGNDCAELVAVTADSWTRAAETQADEFKRYLFHLSEGVEYLLRLSTGQKVVGSYWMEGGQGGWRESVTECLIEEQFGSGVYVTHYRRLPDDPVPGCATCEDSGEVEVSIGQAGDQSITEWHDCPDCSEGAT